MMILYSSDHIHENHNMIYYYTGAWVPRPGPIRWWGVTAGIWHAFPHHLQPTARAAVYRWPSDQRDRRHDGGQYNDGRSVYCHDGGQYNDGRSVYCHDGGRYIVMMEVGILSWWRSVYYHDGGRYTIMMQVGILSWWRSVYYHDGGRYTIMMEVGILSWCRSVYYHDGGRYTIMMEVGILSWWRSVYYHDGGWYYHGHRPSVIYSSSRLIKPPLLPDQRQVASHMGGPTDQGLLYTYRSHDSLYVYIICTVCYTFKADWSIWLCHCMLIFPLYNPQSQP